MEAAFIDWRYIGSFDFTRCTPDLLFQKKMNAKSSIDRNATPPITPPAIAPTFVPFFFVPGVAITDGEGVELGVITSK